MTVANGAPGVEFNEIDESTNVTAASSDQGGFLGITQRGPMTPKFVTDWPAYKRRFGEEIADSDLPDCAKRALAGGAGLWVKRIVALDGSGDPTSVAAFIMLQTTGGGSSKGKVTGTVEGDETYDTALEEVVRTWPITPGMKIAWKIDGGAKEVITIDAGPASLSLANQATFVLANGQTITYQVGVGDSMQPPRLLTFATGDFADIANATVQEVYNVLARDLIGIRVTKAANIITLTSDQKGGNAAINITGGTAVTPLGTTVGLRVGSGDVNDADRVPLTSIQAKINTQATELEVYASDAGFPVLERNVAGSTKSVQIVTSDADETAGAAAFGWDTNLHAGTSDTAVDTLKLTAGQFGEEDHGAWANGATGGLKVSSANATLNPSTRFRLTLTYQGDTVLDEDELSMDPEDDRYVITVLGSSRWLIAEDQDAEATVSTFAAARPAVQAGTNFASGADGLGGIADSDYEGNEADKTGFYAFDAIEEISFLGTPGVTSRDLFDAGVGYCAARKNCVFLGDIPKTLSRDEALDYRKATGAYAGGTSFDSSFGALYFNWIEIDDPLNKGQTKFIPPMGDVFAAWATADIDGRKTAWAAPAGPTNGKLLSGAKTLFHTLSDADVGVLHRNGINPIRSHPQYGFVIWGERNLQAVASSTDRIHVRRGLIFLAVSLRPVIERLALFEPNDQQTWNRVTKPAERFLDEQVQVRGLFPKITSPKDPGYRFVLDETTVTDGDVEQNKMPVKLFVRPGKKAEFVPVDTIVVGQSGSL